MARAENTDGVTSEPAPRRARGGSVTLRDVARFAGVSSATVSRVMNNPDAVSEQLRARIEVAIKHLGWVPSAAARALATQRTGTVGAIFPTLANEHFASAIQALQEAFEQHGYTLLLGCSEYQTDRELRQVRKMLERGVDAFVVVGDTHRPELYPLLEQRATPVVSTFNYSTDSHVPCTGVDNYRAFFDLTTYLLDLGHRSFGMLAQSTDSNDRARARREGVRDALAVQGLGMNPAHLVEGFWSVNEGRRLFRQVLEPARRPTAVICGNGSFAMGAMLEAMACGIDVPGEMTIAGFDDFELMAELPVPITTVRVPSVEIGRQAAEMIIAQLDGKNVDSREFEAQMIVRASSGPPPNGP